MSNLLKGYWVSVKEETKMVDSNELVQIKVKEEEERMARLRYIMDQQGEEGEAEFQEGLPAANLDALLVDGGVQPIGVPNEESDELSFLNAEIEAKAQELQELSEQAVGIIQNAQAEAEDIKQQAFEQAQNDGYQNGYEQGMAQCEELRAELEEQARAMEAQYQEAVEQIEPQLVDAITDVYEHIFKVDLSAYKNLVASLVIDAVIGSGAAKNIIVHVSREDYPNIISMKEDILTNTGTMEDNVEFIQDATLNESGCLIETDNGIFDCSLDVELSELKRKLMILAYRK